MKWRKYARIAIRNIGPNYPMHSAAINVTERPTWQRGVRQRLIASIAFAAVLVVAFLGLVKFAANDEPVSELKVRLLPPESVPEIEPALQIEPAPLAQEALEELPEPVEPSVATPPITDEPPQPRDWYTDVDDVVKATVASRQKVPSPNPAFDAKRREATVKFAPSRAPQKRPIWENVERDQLGRRILVSGDCYRVVDDPSAVNNEMFRMFQQYMVYCTKQGSSPQELPWVDAIRDRYDYLTRQDTVGADDRADLFATLQ